MKINLGSGKDYREGFVNVDINPEIKCDYVLDLSAYVPYDWIGKVSLIVANDVLEHVPNLVKLMTNCLEMLEDGGEFHISVPYDLSYGAWQDPTHVRAFNEKSWIYYTDWHWYLGWKDRFDVISLQMTKSNIDFGDIPDEQLVRTPRAIDSMQVILKKRIL